MSDHILERDARHRYKCVNSDHTTEPCHGIIFDSVTTILGKAVPKNLAWHGQTRGVIGVKGLLRIPKYNVQQMKPGEIMAACRAEGIVRASVNDSPGKAERVKLSVVPKYDVTKMSPDAITDALKRERLTVNDHMRDAADGGTAVHRALEDYATKGLIPNASAVPESKRGSIIGLAKFIVEYKPEFVATEVKVLSVEHAYAGTFDLLCRIPARVDYEPVWSSSGKGATKTKDQKMVLVPDPSGSLTVLADLKTSKWVYPSSHFPQLEAYEGARLEMGEDPTDVRAVLWVNVDGDMQLVPSTASFEDFLALKASAEVIGRLDKSWRRPRKMKA